METVNYSYILFIITTTVFAAAICNYYWYQSINHKRDTEAIFVNIWLLLLVPFGQIATHPSYLIPGKELNTTQAVFLWFLFLFLNIACSLIYMIYYSIKTFFLNLRSENDNVTSDLP